MGVELAWVFGDFAGADSVYFLLSGEDDSVEESVGEGAFRPDRG